MISLDILGSAATQGAGPATGIVAGQGEGPAQGDVATLKRLDLYDQSQYTQFINSATKAGSPEGGAPPLAL